MYIYNYIYIFTKYHSGHTLSDFILYLYSTPVFLYRCFRCLDGGATRLKIQIIVLRAKFAVSRYSGHAALIFHVKPYFSHLITPRTSHHLISSPSCCKIMSTKAFKPCTLDSWYISFKPWLKIYFLTVSPFRRSFPPEEIEVIQLALSDSIESQDQTKLLPGNAQITFCDWNFQWKAQFKIKILHQERILANTAGSLLAIKTGG